MNDRTLLELAARAAGLGIEFIPAATRNKGSSLTKFEVTAWNGPFIAGTDGEDPWNPLADDGDALRLADKLNMAVYFSASGKTAEAPDGPGPVWEETDYRRAIVRAAAEIGSQMK